MQQQLSKGSHGAGKVAAAAGAAAGQDCPSAGSAHALSRPGPLRRAGWRAGQGAGVGGKGRVPEGPATKAHWALRRRHPIPGAPIGNPSGPGGRQRAPPGCIAPAAKPQISRSPQPCTPARCERRARGARQTRAGPCRCGRRWPWRPRGRRRRQRRPWWLAVR